MVGLETWFWEGWVWLSKSWPLSLSWLRQNGGLHWQRCIVCGFPAGKVTSPGTLQAAWALPLHTGRAVWQQLALCIPCFTQHCSCTQPSPAAKDGLWSRSPDTSLGVWCHGTYQHRLKLCVSVHLWLSAWSVTGLMWWFLIVDYYF